MDPNRYCREKASQSGSSFYYSFFFLPEEKRAAIIALYAFCREVDDIADDCTEPSVARAKLAWWRGEVAQLFAGRPSHPVAQALVPVVQRHDLAAEQFLEIIDGMEMDLDQNRYADFKSLNLYCYRVAGVVGELSAQIFGYQDRKTLKYAHDLGLAFQLTNIIRDVGEDARRNRIYLPLDELTQFGVDPNDILQGKESAAFHALMRFQIGRARRYYEQALRQLPAADRKAQLPGLMMAGIYRTVLDEIERDGCHVLRYRLALPAWRKLWIAARTWLKG